MTTIGVTNRDTRSLDFGSYRDQEVMEFCVEVSWAVVSGLSFLTTVAIDIISAIRTKKRMLSENWGSILGCAHGKDHGFLGSILGCPSCKETTRNPCVALSNTISKKLTIGPRGLIFRGSAESEDGQEPDGPQRSTFCDSFMIHCPCSGASQNQSRPSEGLGPRILGFRVKSFRVWGRSFFKEWRTSRYFRTMGLHWPYGSKSVDAAYFGP